MRRANHGSAVLSVTENQDTRVAHQVRQVQRRELRKDLRKLREENASLKAAPAPPVQEVPTRIVRKDGVLTIHNVEVRRERPKDPYGAVPIDHAAQAEKPRRWLPPVGGRN